VTRFGVGLATSNGTGMGHLARQISVALALADRADPVVFSMSTAVPIVRTHDLRAEYCPSHHRGWMPQMAWHGYLRDRLRAFAAETGIRVVVFDGVAPYLGLLRARAALPDVAFVWVRRGLWRPGINTAALRARPFFDLVLEPADLAAEADRGATARLDDAVGVPPVTLLEHVAPLPRAAAAAALGLDPDRPTALVTLGAGSINDVVTPATAAMRALLASPDWQVAVTRAPLAQDGTSLLDPSRAVELRGIYPLARYLSAFDAAVGAAGYNTFHELLLARIPTLLVPNRSAATDDQAARAHWAAEHHLALVAEEADPDSVATQAARLHDPAIRDALRAACSRLPEPTGAAAAADALATLASGYDHHQPRFAERLHTAELTARAAAVRMLGPGGTAFVRRALGRRQYPGPARPLTVRPVEDGPDVTGPATGPDSLVLTERLDPELLRAGHPVEHLLPGSSAAYREERMRIARRYYDVRTGDGVRAGA
jgi:Glycosyltransferase family 28 C-terminal domain